MFACAGTFHRAPEAFQYVDAWDNVREKLLFVISVNHGEELMWKHHWHVFEHGAKHTVD